jgi:hypothetical protein
MHYMPASATTVTIKAVLLLKLSWVADRSQEKPPFRSRSACRSGVATGGGESDDLDR